MSSDGRIYVKGAHYRYSYRRETTGLPYYAVFEKDGQMFEVKKTKIFDGFPLHKGCAYDIQFLRGARAFYIRIGNYRHYFDKNKIVKERLLSE